MTIWSFYHKTIEFLHHGFKSSKIRLFSLLKTGILKYLGKIQLVYLVIEEGNWLHSQDSAIEKPEGGFDALICMGNSFAHLPDTDGNQAVHYQAIQNFYDFLRPGGILIIDHRNYDHIVAGNKAPMKNIYYQVSNFWLQSSIKHFDKAFRVN